MRGKPFLPIWVCVSVSCLCMIARAQDQGEFTVDVIEFRGLNRVSDQLVRSQLEQEIAEPYSPKAVARDILRLYEMGMFSTIKVEMSGMLY